MQTHDALSILKETFIGKTLLGLEFGLDGEDRQEAIGKKIVNVGFGFNDSREDAGVILTLDKSDEYNFIVIFVYDSEEITVE